MQIEDFYVGQLVRVNRPDGLSRQHRICHISINTGAIYAAVLEPGWMSQYNRKFYYWLLIDDDPPWKQLARALDL